MRAPRARRAPRPSTSSVLRPRTDVVTTGHRELSSALRVACPTCHQPPGKGCRTLQGRRPTSTHAARRERAA